MKRKFCMLVGAACVSAMLLSGCSGSSISQEDYDSLNAQLESVQDELNANKKSLALKSTKTNLEKVFDNITVAESVLDEGTVLYITAGTDEDSGSIIAEITKLMAYDWFDYDYVMLNQYAKDLLASSFMIKCTGEQQASYYIWFDDSGQIIKYNEDSANESGEDEHATNDSTESSSDSEDKSVYSVGEVWTVDGLWNFSINSVTVTEDRNRYSDKSPEQVVIIDYSYENLGYAGSAMDLYFSEIDMKVIDGQNEVGYSYPATTAYSPQEAPIGAKCAHAQVCFGLNNVSSEITIIVNNYGNEHDSYTATFKVPIE